MRGSEWRTRTLDERTDRLARRLYGLGPLPRDTYLWATLRVNVAGHDVQRTVRRELTPAFQRLGQAMDFARAAAERFGQAFR